MLIDDAKAGPGGLMIDELSNIVDSLKAGRAVDRVPVRMFLSWFGAQRRGWGVVSYIRGQLQEAGLVTVPDFESRYMDGLIAFQLVTSIKEEEEAPDTADMPAVDEAIGLDSTSPPSEPVTSWVSKDPSYRISKLAAANSGVTSIKRDASLAEAATLMMARDFSQLPVMTGERDVQGIISWKSIGSRLALGYGADIVNKLMERAHEVRADTS